MTAKTLSGATSPPTATQTDNAGRDGSPDRGGRPADAVSTGEEFASGGFGGYQGGNQADPHGGDAGGRTGLGGAPTAAPADREQATKPPDRT